MMRRRIPFVKMHGIGNDFAIINGIEHSIKIPNKLARDMCNRRFGVGGDGLLIVCHSDNADYFMRMFNSDGSEGSMCGNGIRCFAKYIFDQGLLNNKKKTYIETLAGIKIAEFRLKKNELNEIRINMGYPQFKRSEIPMQGIQSPVLNEKLRIEDQNFTVCCLSTGVPHTVVFIDDLNAISDMQFRRFGQLIEQNEMFPQKTNVMFTEVIEKNIIKIRPWERGSGETLSCGTGSSAAAVASILTQKCDNLINVINPGGTLKIEWKEWEEIYMTGPAEEVFVGEWPIF